MEQKEGHKDIPTMEKMTVKATGAGVNEITTSIDDGNNVRPATAAAAARAWAAAAMARAAVASNRAAIARLAADQVRAWADMTIWAVAGTDHAHRKATSDANTNKHETLA